MCSSPLSAPLSPLADRRPKRFVFKPPISEMREYVFNANFVLRAGFTQQIKRWFFSFGANLR
jgi:hypothetical protein